MLLQGLCAVPAISTHSQKWLAACIAVVTLHGAYLGLSTESALAQTESNQLQATDIPLPPANQWKKGPWSITPYGSLEGQLLNATDEVTGRTTVLYVDEKSSFGPLPQCNLQGQASALGFDFAGPDVGDLHSGGKIFMNFMGDRPLLNQSTPFLINAYGELANDDWRILFGQYFALVNPLNPTMINFGLGIDTGNICSYRGQFRLERFFHPAENLAVTTQIAASQQFITDFVPSGEEDESGTDNGLPNLDGRMALAIGPKLDGLDTRTFELGISGMVGQARILHMGHKFTPTEDMFGCDVQLASERIGVKGEFFYGQGLSSYGGGIGQSINLLNGQAIRDAGGWFEIWTKPFPRVTVAVGYGIDQPTLADLFGLVDVMRSRNEVYYATVLWDVTSRFNVGLEVDYRATDYFAPPLTDEPPGTRNPFVANNAIVTFFRAKLSF